MTAEPERDCLICGATESEVAANSCPCSELEFDAFEEDHCLDLILWLEQRLAEVAREAPTT